MRFAHGQVDHAAAVAHSRVLFQAAAEAGVQRIVHVSITHPERRLALPVFPRQGGGGAGAGAICGVSHAVLRPAILFGGNGVLINNIAWLLRHLPVFAVGGTGEYRIRPIHVDDLARLAVRAADSATTETIDAVGPERPAFIDLVRTIKNAVGSRSQIVRVPGAFIAPAARLLGLALRDTLLTADEYQGMADGLADTEGPATGETVAEPVDHRPQGHPGPRLRQRAHPALPVTAERARAALSRGRGGGTTRRPRAAGPP